MDMIILLVHSTEVVYNASTTAIDNAFAQIWSTSLPGGVWKSLNHAYPTVRQAMSSVFYTISKRLLTEASSLAAASESVNTLTALCSDAHVLPSMGKEGLGLP